MNSTFYTVTPLHTSSKLKKELNLNIYYKMECSQPSGSFKIRGMDTLCRHHFAEGKRDFIASSGGNAGYSLAYVGKQLGVKVKVVVPQTTSVLMIAKIKNLGASVQIVGDVWDEADQYARKLAEETDAVYVSPFDDPLLWKGHASLIDECAQQMRQPDKIIVSVGGGGLLCGIFEGMKRNGWMDTEVITTETMGAASFYKSYHAKKRITLDEIKTVATSLGAKTVAKQSLKLASEFKVQPHLMTDEQAVNATRIFSEEYNFTVEAACGAALSVPFFYPELISENEHVLVVVCGGVNPK
jgi:L-serine/L-threonine ammonia-lyase